MNDILYKPFIRDTPDFVPVIRGYQRIYNPTPRVKNQSSEEVSEEAPIVEPVVSPIVEVRKEVEKYQPSVTAKGFDAFKDAYTRSGVRSDRFNFFARIAQQESGFNPKIQNSLGAPAYGYFQFMQGKDKGRSWDNIQRFAGVDIETFRNSPELQIRAADKLADSFLKGFNEKDLKRARELGYSNSALIAGAWLGGVDGVRKLLHYNKNVDDKSWDPNGKKGVDMRTQMDKFNNMFKKGGVLKFEDGGDTSSKDWLKDWYYNREDILKSNIDNNMPIPVPFMSKLGYNIVAKNIDLANIKQSDDMPSDAVGMYTPGNRTIYLRDLNDKDAELHEYVHASGPKAQVDEINKIMKILGDTIYDNNTIIPDEYLDDANEIYARLMELRRALEIDPNHEWTKEEVEDVKKLYTKYITLTNRLKSNNRAFNTTVFDKDGNIVKMDKLEEGEKYIPEESTISRTYDTRGTYNMLNRYSTDFLLRLFNNVASNNKKDLTNLG